MASSEPFRTLRLIVKDLIDTIGREKAYSTVNTMYANAPAFKHLDKEVIVQRFVDIIGQKYGRGEDLKVFIMEDPAIEEKSINGMYAFYPQIDSVYIVINATMNYCWKTFTLLKELCHVYVDFDNKLSSHIQTKKEHNYRASLEKVFDETKKFKNFDFSSLSDLYEMDEEMCIVLLAIELMIPIYDRDELMLMISQLAQPPVHLTVNDIAKAILIPEYLLQKYIDLKAIDCDPQYTEMH